MGEGPGTILSFKTFLSFISRLLVTIFLGWEDTLGKEMETHSSTLAWKIPWREEPGNSMEGGAW